MNVGAGQASEIGTRLGKLVRMVRLVRLLRLSKALEKQSKGADDSVDLSSMRKVEFLKEKKDNKDNKDKKIKKNSIAPLKSQNSTLKNESIFQNKTSKFHQDNIEEAPLQGLKISRRGRMSLMIRNETHRNVILRSMIQQVLKERKEKEEQEKLKKKKSIKSNNENQKNSKNHHNNEFSTHSEHLSKSPSLRKNKNNNVKDISIDEYEHESRDISELDIPVKKEKESKIEKLKRQISKFSNVNLEMPEEETKIYETEKILERVSKKTDIILPKKSVAVKIWNERIIKKLIFLVLIMNAVMTFFGADFYTNDIEPWTSNLNDLGELYTINKDPIFIKSFIDVLEEDFKSHDYNLIGLEFSDKFINIANNSALSILRNGELRISYFAKDDFRIKLTLSAEKLVTYQRVLNLGGLFFIILILMTSYYFFTKDSNDLVMNPLYKVVKVLNVLLKQPLNPNINGFYLAEKYEDKIFTENEQEYSKIVAVLCRLCLYLSISFGAKNVDFMTNLIIMQNKELRDENLKGERVFAYYAYIEIKDLFDLIVCENEEVFLFINNIVEILDRTTDRYKGRTENHLLKNKFLLIWHLESKNEIDNFIEINRNSSETATMAITNILKILIKIHKFMYSSNSPLKDLKNVLTPKERHMRRDFQDYIKVTLDAGKIYQSFIGSIINTQVIHYGSDLLSTQKLHKISEIYNCPFLITNKVYDILSETIKTYCRKIDVVKYERIGKSSNIAKPLYAMDITGRKLIIESEIKLMKNEVDKAVRRASISKKDRDQWVGLEGKENEEEMKEENEGEISKFEPEDNPIFEDYDTPPTIYEKRMAHCEIKSQILIQLRKGEKNRLFMDDTDIQLILNKKYEFRRNFRSAIDFYLLGAWDAAKEYFEKSLEIMPNDGPSLSILKYMDKYSYEKPVDWRGYRYLD